MIMHMYLYVYVCVLYMEEGVCLCMQDKKKVVSCVKLPLI